MMRQQTVELQAQPAKTGIPSPTGFVFGSTQKMTLLVIVGLLLYLRLHLRRRKKDRICAHCGHRNPTHRQNCTKCSAPLMHT